MYYTVSLIINRVNKTCNKTKIDYASIYTDKIESNQFKSRVSPEIFSGLSWKKDHYEKFWKNKEQIYYLCMYEVDEENMTEHEKTYLPIIENNLKKKIFFNFKEKKALEKRIKRLLPLVK